MQKRKEVLDSDDLENWKRQRTLREEHIGKVRTSDHSQKNALVSFGFLPLTCIKS